MRALIPLLTVVVLVAAGCGDDDPLAPLPTSPLTLHIRFINGDVDPVTSVDLRCQITEPGETTPRIVSHNWQPVAQGAEFTLVDADTIPPGTVVQAWFSVLALWSEGEVLERWRVWTTDAETLRTDTDARYVFHWPEDRWDLTEVPWPPHPANSPPDGRDVDQR